MSVEKEIRKILAEATPASARAKQELVRSGLGHDKNSAAVMAALKDPEAAMANPAKREMLLKVMQDLLDVVVNDPTMVSKTKSALHKEEVELDEAIDPSEIASNPKAYSSDDVKKAYYHKKTTKDDKDALERHLDNRYGNRNWRKPMKEEVEELEEKLVGGQKKLDVNKNGKLDAEDFKKLRKEEYTSNAQRKAVWASRNDAKEAMKRKMKKESIEEAQDYTVKVTHKTKDGQEGSGTYTLKNLRHRSAAGYIAMDRHREAMKKKGIEVHSSSAHIVENKDCSSDMKKKVEDQKQTANKLVIDYNAIKGQAANKAPTKTLGIKLNKEDVAEGIDDIVKGIKRKIAGKADPKTVEQDYAVRARQRIADANKHNNQPAYADRDKAIKRYKKISKVVSKEETSHGPKNMDPKKLEAMRKKMADDKDEYEKERRERKNKEANDDIKEAAEQPAAHSFVAHFEVNGKKAKKNLGTHFGTKTDAQKRAEALAKKYDGLSGRKLIKVVAKEETQVDEGLQQALRKHVPGYAKKQIDQKMDRAKFGRTDADKDANYYRYKKVADKIAKEETQVDEAGPFSYGAKPPRKGTVAYNAMMKRKEQEKNYKPIEPKDHMVGTAKVVKEVFDSREFDRHMERLKAQKELEKTDPMRAMVNKMRADDEHAKQKKSPKRDDERKITDPFHHSQSVNIRTEETQVDEAFPTVADAKKRMKDALKSKFEKKKISTGTVYTKKYKEDKEDDEKKSDK